MGRIREFLVQKQIKIRIAEFIEGKYFHFFIIILIISDVIILFLDHLIYIVNECRDDHRLVLVEAVMKWYSFSVLVIFGLELLLKIFVFGLTYLLSFWHIMDIIIVFSALVVSLISLGPVYGNIGTIIIIARIIRLILFGHEIADAERIKVHQLKKKLKAKQFEIDTLTNRLRLLQNELNTVNMYNLHSDFL
jgi:voltage-gated hydrogen channel 1